MFTETSILYHISKKLGIADKVAKYDGISEENIIEEENIQVIKKDFNKK